MQSEKKLEIVQQNQVIDWYLPSEEKDYILQIVKHAQLHKKKLGKNLIYLEKDPVKLYRQITPFFRRERKTPVWVKPLTRNVYFNSKGEPCVSVSESKSGAFGTYNKCQNLTNGDIVGVKTQTTDSLSLKHIYSENNFLKKIYMLKDMIIQKTGFFWNRKYISYSFHNHLNGKVISSYKILNDKVKEMKPEKAVKKASMLSDEPFNLCEASRVRSPEFAFLVAMSALLHLSFIHSKGIIHRDIGPQNIIIGENFSLSTIIDFGVAANLDPKKNYINDFPRVRAWYVPPECCNLLDKLWGDRAISRLFNYLRGKYNYNYTQQDDLYSLGYSLSDVGVIDCLQESKNDEHQELAKLLKTFFSEDKLLRPKNTNEVFQKLNIIFKIEQNKTCKLATEADKWLTFFINKRQLLVDKNPIQHAASNPSLQN